MGRYPRIEGKSLVYFISSRGRNGQKIFWDDEDKNCFINLLKKQRIRSKLIFYGYVLLPDLYAYLLETHKNNLVQCMHRINSGYANYFNRRHHCQHKLFHDRYNCYILEKKSLVEVSRYLHLLPVNAKIVTNPALYSWSSYPGYVDSTRREEWISYNCILKMFNENRLASSLTYQKFVDEMLKTQISSPFENLGKGNLLGSKNFRREIYTNRQSDHTDALKEDLILAQKIIELVNQYSTWPSLRANRKRIAKTILSRNATIYLLKKFTDLNNQQISRFFRSLKASSMSQMSRRFDMASKKNKSLRRISESLESKIKNIALYEK